jgi:putative spermidine/putrescine transport system ATP-binding protein
MADRVAVFSQGRIEQLDTPRELYARPRTAFVAKFVGSANVIPTDLARRLTGRANAFAIRPELIDIVAPGAPVREDDVACEGVVVDVLYHGASSRCRVQIDDGTILAVDRREAAVTPPSAGSRVRLAWRRDHAAPLEA